MTIGAISAADNTSQNDVAIASDLSDTEVESCSADCFYINMQENCTQDNGKTLALMDDVEKQSSDMENSVLSIENYVNETYESAQQDLPQNIGTLNLAENDSLSSDNIESHGESPYENKYYLFRGDCWTVNNNFESSAAVTSETLNDLTVTGTFRTENDLVGLYWNSKDPIQHPYISYGNRSDYSDVILEFDYEMTGCMDFSNGIISITIAANTGEMYFLTMNRFIENRHVTLNFNNLTLLPGNSYLDRNGQSVTVAEETKLNVTNLKFIMLLLLPLNFVENSTHYTIAANTNFTCKISNITVANGEICNELPQLDSHQYNLCEGYDDSYNLNPFRLAKEMRKLGYADWVDLYIGASYFYEKSGNIGDVISDMNLNHNRTEKMVLDENVPLNAAFKAWLDCYSRELKNNNVNNLVISVSMENLQCPQSWRQMDSNGDFAMTGWNPSTFIYSPCHEDVVPYVKKVCEACLDIVVGNGLQPILQMGETWWWWNENDWPNQSPCFYDDSTKSKYLAEHGTALPEYDDAWSIDYDETSMQWLNQQLVQYSDALREVVKSDKYTDGLYMALLFLPSVTDTDRVPPMMRDANRLQDIYSPYKLDVLQLRIMIGSFLKILTMKKHILLDKNWDSVKSVCIILEVLSNILKTQPDIGH